MRPRFPVCPHPVLSPLPHRQFPARAPLRDCLYPHRQPRGRCRGDRRPLCIGPKSNFHLSAFLLGCTVTTRGYQPCKGGPQQERQRHLLRTVLILPVVALLFCTMGARPAFAGCSEATLNGDYLGNLTGTTTTGSVALQVRARFNGNGTAIASRGVPSRFGFR